MSDVVSRKGLGKGSPLLLSLSLLHLAGYLISDQSDLHLDTSVAAPCAAAMRCAFQWNSSQSQLGAKQENKNNNKKKLLFMERALYLQFL